MTHPPTKLWGGRFQKATDRLVEEFTASIQYDWRLYRQDIAGSTAHARMLARQGIISAEDADRIVAGLREIEGEIARGELPLRAELEDIHMTVEARLREKIGDAAGRLHTARSRNDQIALDLRLYLREVVGETDRLLHALQHTLLGRAREVLGVVLPGYTHLQRAQPVLLTHHLLAYVEMFDRDRARLADCRKRIDVMPLGSGALAGVPYAIDRASVADELGFPAISRNSLDAVSDRDFAVELLAAAAIIMMHLSRLAEELVIWTTAEFGFTEMDDAYATGSSIMPQKKNPDVAELVRGKTGRVYGHLMALLTLLKGLPLSYNRDLQEDKEAVFDAVDTLQAALAVADGMLATLRFRSDRMRRAAEANEILATDFADYLVRKGLPFREAHAAVGRLVRDAADQGKELLGLTIEELRRASPLFDEDVRQIRVESSVDARDVPGGTARRQVEQALAEAEARIGP